MMARRHLIPLLVICAGVAAFAYDYSERAREVSLTQTEAKPCDSCSARKKDLGRLRQTLNPKPGLME
jgi:hypothetical protein